MKQLRLSLIIMPEPVCHQLFLATWIWSKAPVFSSNVLYWSYWDSAWFLQMTNRDILWCDETLVTAFTVESLTVIKLTDAHSNAALLHNNVLVIYVTERLHWHRFFMTDVRYASRLWRSASTLYTGVNSPLMNIVLSCLVTAATMFSLKIKSKQTL